MTTLYLIRHAENDFMRQHKLAGWLPGIHLNDRGRAQAEGLVPAFEGLRLQALYSSPLERAVETAAPLARAHDLAVHRRPGLGEIHYGRWQGQPLSRLRRLKLWSQVQATPFPRHTAGRRIIPPGASPDRRRARTDPGAAPRRGRLLLARRPDQARAGPLPRAAARSLPAPDDRAGVGQHAAHRRRAGACTVDQRHPRHAVAGRWMIYFAAFASRGRRST